MRQARPSWRATPVEPSAIDAEAMLCEHSWSRARSRQDIVTLLWKRCAVTPAALYMTSRGACGLTCSTIPRIRTRFICTKYIEMRRQLRPTARRHTSLKVRNARSEVLTLAAKTCYNPPQLRCGGPTHGGRRY